MPLLDVLLDLQSVERVFFDPFVPEEEEGELLDRPEVVHRRLFGSPALSEPGEIALEGQGTEVHWEVEPASFEGSSDPPGDQIDLALGRPAVLH